MKVYVVDFDGTLTTFSRNDFRDFEKDYRERLFRVSPCRRSNDFRTVWGQVALEVDKNPGKYGWVPQGVIVSPVYADPYSRCSTIGPMVLDKLGVVDSCERDYILESVFRQSYGDLKVSLKEGVSYFLNQLSKKGKVYIVTNSSSNGMVHKLAAGGVDVSKLVLKGNAQKWYLSGSNVREFEGFPRPIFIERSEYYRVVQRILREEGVSIEEVGFIGDLFEIDLAMPLDEGATVFHAISSWFPDFEKRVTLGLEKAAPVLNLEDVLDF